MRSVANQLRSEILAEMRALPPSARVDLALSLGDQDLEIFRLARGLTPEAASKELHRRKQAGRRPSSCSLDDPE